MVTRTKASITSAMVGAALETDLRAPATFSPLTLSRRKFLAVGIAATGAVHAADLGRLGGMKLQVQVAQEQGLPASRQTWMVALGDKHWDINPRLFGPAAAIHHKYNEAEDQHTLQLKHAWYPGLELQASFTAILYRSQATWKIRLNFVEVGTEQEFALEDWLDNAGTSRYAGPLLGDSRPVQVGTAPCALAALRGDLQLSVDAHLTARLAAVEGMVLACRRIDFQLTGATCEAVNAAARTHAPHSVPAHAEAPFCNIDLAGLASLDNEIRLARIGHHLTAFLHIGPDPAASLIGYGFGNHRDALFLLGGKTEAAALVLRGDACAPGGTRVPLQPYAVLGSLNDLRDQLRLSAHVAKGKDAGFGMETDAMAVLVKSAPTAEPQIELDLSHDSLKGVRFEALLAGADVPLADASAASLAFSTPPVVEVVLGQPDRLAGPANPFRLQLDRTSLFTAPLDAGRLHARRSADGLDLVFRLTHHDLQVTRAGSVLVPRAIPKLPPGEFGPRLSVEFPPQHEFEEVFIATSTPLPVTPHDATPTTKSDSGDKTPRKHGPIPRLVSDRRPNLARTKLANRSRLVFSLGPAPAGTPLPLSVDWLTNWDQATLVVNRRALPRAAGLDAQLALADITQRMGRPEARTQVKKTVLGANLGEPDEFETAIEPVYRLIVSPDQGARFSTPRGQPDPGHPLVWRTDLANEPRVAVRALWARGMNPDFDLTKLVDGQPQDDDFAGSLNANDRRELVTMTSFYGLAALRRLIPDQTTSPLKKLVRKIVKAECQTSTWHDDPNGMVFLPTKHYTYLDPVTVCEVPQEGVVVARPFDRFTLRLGRAADINVLWKGEPPAQYSGSNDPFFAPALTIERYSHRTIQGRDVFVEVLYKGFLFPIGQRATFIRVSYRTFLPYLENVDGDPTAYEVQEYYIVCNKPEKHFRAYNQPFDSHDFPCKTLTLRTVQTPLLEYPQEDFAPPGRAVDLTRPAGMTFWPTPKGRKELLQFVYTIDGQREEARLPLLFVDNAAAHDPATMSAIVEKYNLLKDDDLARRTMTHGAAPRRYADETRQGEVTFKTDTWILQARGRFGKSGETERFDMDAFMEGQDQPAFYPVVQTASVQVESVERLTGRTSIYIQVAFNPRYVRHGFDAAHNPSELVLDVLTRGVKLDGTDCQGSSGGVASMAAELACLSRKTGPVGGQALPVKVPPAVLAAAAAKPGKRRTAARTRSSARVQAHEQVPQRVEKGRAALLLAAPPSSRADVGGGGERQHDISAAEAGTFNPFEFLGDAKLLGLIPLKDVCMAAAMAQAPKLLEQVQHGVGQVQAGIAELRTQLGAVLDRVEYLVCACIEQANAQLAAMGQDLTLRDLYPDLDDALKSVETAVAQARQGLADIDVVGLQKRASDLKHAVDRLLSVLQAIARDPVPTIVEDDLRTLQECAGLIGNSLGTLASEFAGNLAESLLADLLDSWCSEENRYLLAVLLGPAVQTLGDATGVQCTERIRIILRNPADALAELREALLYESFVQPLVALLQAVGEAKAEAERRLLWSKREMTDVITAAILREAPAQSAADVEAPAAAICAQLEQVLVNQSADAIAGTIDTLLDQALVTARGPIEAAAGAAHSKYVGAANAAGTAINRFLADEANHRVDEARRRAYRDNIAILKRAEAARDMAARLSRACSDDAGCKALIGAIKTSLEVQLRRAADARLRELDKFARAQAQRALERGAALADLALAMLVTWMNLRDVQQLGGKYGDLCNAGAGALRTTIKTWSVDLLPETGRLLGVLHDLDTALSDATATLGNLNLPEGQAEALGDALHGRLTTLVSTCRRASVLCDEAMRLQADWAKWEHEDPCKLANLLPAVQNLYGMRAKLSDTFTSALAAVEDCRKAADLVTQRRTRIAVADDFLKAVKAVELALSTLFGHLSGLSAIGDNLQTWKDLKAFAQSVTALQAPATELDRSGNDFKTTQKVLSTLAAYTRADRELAGALMQMVLPQQAFMNALEPKLVTLAKKVADLLLPPVSAVATQIAKLDALVTQGDTGPVLRNVLSRSLLQRLGDATTNLQTDQTQLGSISHSSTVGDLHTVKDLQERWKNGECGIRLSATLAREVVELVTSGNVMALFDPQALTGLLREAVASLIPTSVSLSYDFDAALGDFPSDDPVFTMDRARYGPGTEPGYDDKDPPLNDLVIRTRIDIDLLSGSRTLSAEGRLRPFTINLLGERFDLIGISFGGARFVSQAGRKLQVETQVSGVRIGAMLEFLTLLQDYFSPGGDDNGLHYGIEFAPPALMVEYRYNQPYIEIGAMQLLNVGFHVGARLPLDDRPAEFVAMVSTREKPLLIVMFPYGGGGFLALRANAAGIVAFEIQLEFGFVGALEFGPLSAQARATAGFYLLQSGTERVFEGFFHAMGEGHVACFGVGVNIEFKMRQDSDGTMAGSATYTYSFKVGFFKVSFSVATSRSQDNGTQHHGAAAKVAVAAARTMRAPVPALDCKGKVRSLIRSTAVDKAAHWTAYKQHFAWEDMA